MPAQGQFYFNPGMMGNMNMPMNNMNMQMNNMGGMMPMNNMGMMQMNNMGGMMPMNNMGMMYNGFVNPMCMPNNMTFNGMGGSMPTPNQSQLQTQPQNPNQKDPNDKGVLPRGNITNGDTLAKGEDMCNITFDASTGVKTIINAKKDEPFKEIFKKYMNKIGLPESYIGTQIVFLFNGKKLEGNSEETPKKLKLQNMASVTVFDVGNVIGA